MVKTSGTDNSFGMGNYPLPARLSGLGRFVENLRPTKLVEQKVFPNEGIWMLTAKVDTHLSIMAEDMKSLLRLGLMRVQCNNVGTLSFYFQDEPISAGTSTVLAHNYDRRK